MAGLLPSQMRCSAFWYAQARGLPTDIGYLKALGLTAYRMAVWEGLAPWRVREGPFLVYMWPERIWDAASQGLVRDPGCDDRRQPEPGHERQGPRPDPPMADDDDWYGRDPGDGPDVIPPWCQLPQGDQARFAIGY
jgi:hypothetical protein